MRLGAELRGLELFAVTESKREHFDLTALRTHKQALFGDCGDGADSAFDLGESARRMLACIEQLQLLAVQLCPRGGRRVAAANEVVDDVHVVMPVDLCFGV